RRDTASPSARQLNVRRGVLALDQGGHASRACVIDETGEIISTREVAVSTRHGPGGEVEQDANEILASLQTAAATAIESAAGVAIEAAGLATQRSTIVCFERQGGATLSPAISWQDRRNARWLDSFSPHAQRITALTGLPLSPHYGVGKM